MKRIKVGIIGCGEVVQINHLPSLRYLEDLFEVVAISDISSNVLEKVGDMYQIPHRTTNYQELLSLGEVEAVLIATPNPFHTEQTLAAIAAGKHVLVEKPMSITLEEADQVIEARKRSGLVVQVGYMRRYATSFLEALHRKDTMGNIRLARVHDVIGQNPLIIQPTSRVVKGDDVPEQARKEASQLYKKRVQEAIGKAPEILYQVYGLLLGLSTHDISAMRELLGMPDKVLYAAHGSCGSYVTTAFDYGEFICHFETGVDDIPRFDCHIEVYSSSSVLRVVYQTPYVRHLATRLEVIETVSPGNIHTEVVQPAFEDNFTQEWKSFYDNITLNKIPKTSPEDYRQDLEIFQDIIEAMKK